MVLQKILEQFDSSTWWQNVLYLNALGMGTCIHGSLNMPYICDVRSRRSASTGVFFRSAHRHQPEVVLVEE